MILETSSKQIRLDKLGLRKRLRRVGGGGVEKDEVEWGEGRHGAGRPVGDQPGKGVEPRSSIWVRS